MGAFKGAIITKKGQELLAKVLAGTSTIEFTNIRTSEGVLSGDLASKTGIGTIKQTSKVASVSYQNGSNVKVSASFSNTELTAGYYIRNIGLYALDTSGAEILYSISVADESIATADWMPPFNGVGVSSLMVDIITAVSNASNVNIEVDPTATATVAQITNLQKQIDEVTAFVGYTEDDIYGVEVDFKSKTVTRVAGANTRFDSLAPWGGRRRCNITDDGKVVAYYGEAGYTDGGILTEDVMDYGGVEPIVLFPAGTRVQVMVEQPIFYVKAVPIKAEETGLGNGNQYVKARFYISPTFKSGFSVPRAFYDNNGNIQNKIYLSAYEGSIYDTSNLAYLENDEQVADFDADMFSSVGYVKPASGSSQKLTRANVRKLCNNRGNGWQSHNIFAMAVTQWLFMVEYASLDPQRKIGRGVSNIEDNGTSRSVFTGQTDGFGGISGQYRDEGEYSVTYRGEENLWGNIWTWLDGINVYNGRVWVPKIGTAPVEDTKDGYECLEAGIAGVSGYISTFGIDTKHPEILIPTENMSSDTFTDYVAVDSSKERSTTVGIMSNGSV